MSAFHSFTADFFRLSLVATLFVISFTKVAAEEPVFVPKPRPKIPAINLLPPGSELKGVILPQYDEQHRLTGVMKSESMTLVSPDQIAASIISVDLFNPDQSPKARIELISAKFNQEKGQLVSRETVKIRSIQMLTTGGGIHFLLSENKGFLMGPVTTRLKLATTP